MHFAILNSLSLSLDSIQLVPACRRKEGHKRYLHVSSSRTTLFPSPPPQIHSRLLLHRDIISAFPRGQTLVHLEEITFFLLLVQNKGGRKAIGFGGPQMTSLLMRLPKISSFKTESQKSECLLDFD